MNDIARRRALVFLLLTLGALDLYFLSITKAQNVLDEKRGFATVALRCLAAGPESSGPTTGEVNLQWQGRAAQARLILTVAGAEAAHAIKVNGQTVAHAPIHPEGQRCGEGEVYYLDLPRDVVKPGINTIALTNDALTSDTWRASAIRLEVLGAVDPALGDPATAQAAAGSAIIATISFRNDYDNSTQEARFQPPSSYNSATPTPLILVILPSIASPRAKPPV